MNRHACRPSAPSSTRAILDRVNVRTIGLIDRLVAIAVTTTIAATPWRLLAGRVGMVSGGGPNDGSGIRGWSRWRGC